MESDKMKCDVCSAEVSELRRGRCWGCYTRWVESRPVGFGASCIMCSDRRRDNLRSLELLGSWMPCCHNCAARIHELQPLPQTMGAIRTALMRDRRFKLRRLGNRIDDRVLPRDRRLDDRRRVRALGKDDSVIMDEAMILGIDDEMILDIERLADELAGVSDDTDDLTRIRELPLQAEPAGG